MPRLKVRLRDLVKTDRQIRCVLGGPGVAPDRPSRDLVCRPVRVAALASAGERGCLVLSDGQIAAVLVRVDCDDEVHDGAGATAAGGWFLEAGFGHCSVAVPPLFGSLAEALAWVGQRVAPRGTAGVNLPDAARADGRTNVRGARSGTGIAKPETMACLQLHRVTSATSGTKPQGQPGTPVTLGDE